MQYSQSHKKSGTITVRVMCAVCFLAFSFVWVYWFQADMLAVAQHVLSQGVTHYDRTLGALIVTLVLYLLQLVTFTLTRLSRRTHALTYLPSMLLLAMLSGIDAERHTIAGYWWWLAPLVLLLWGGGVWLARQMSPFEKDGKLPVGLFSRRSWLNLSQMALMMLFVALLSNTHAVAHFRAHAEVALVQGNVDEALRVGRQSHETDQTLTMLRAYALARKGQLGERLFEYPVVGTSDNLLPTYSPLQILSPDSIWTFLGARPAFPMHAYRYFYCVEHDSLASPAIRDYVLCAYLIDRDLEGFARALPRYYDTTKIEALPRYYREALDLYEQPLGRPGKSVSDFERSKGTYWGYFNYPTQ
jgi:hypothetical protein